jgi:hypothetical protein
MHIREDNGASPAHGPGFDARRRPGTAPARGTLMRMPGLEAGGHAQRLLRLA